MDLTGIRRGDVLWFDFASTGAPIRKRRPALVVQNDIANRFSPQTILVAIREDSGKGLPVHVPIPAGIAGLTKDSVVDCGFVVTAPAAALGGRVGLMPAEYMQQVDRALRVSLALG